MPRDTVSNILCIAVDRFWAASPNNNH